MMKQLITNARIYTLVEDLVVNSMVIDNGRIIAIGDNLENSSQFNKYKRINCHGRVVLPGFVDAHTHFVFYALSLGRVHLSDQDTLSGCQKKISNYAKSLKKGEWIAGEGFSPDKIFAKDEPDRFMLDKVTGDHPAFIFSKDEHIAWVNTKALKLGGLLSNKTQPTGGEVVRLTDGTASGVLKEKPGYDPVYDKIPQPSKSYYNKYYRKALEIAYSRGVTGVHSFDSPDSFKYLINLAEKKQTGLRINYYPPPDLLPDLIKSNTVYGTGNDFLRIAGIKIFADGSLGSQTALCFNKYIGSKNSYGIETLSSKKMLSIAKQASKLGLPLAVHAIGDKAVSNVLDALEKAPKLKTGARHRIEHLQLIRPKDIKRLKELNVIASMQPSHCPADIDLIYKYWGSKGKNAFIFNTLINKGIDLAFGSDVPIEPLNPLHGIAAAVRRSRKGSRKSFYSNERITVLEAVKNFTIGPAIASGQEKSRGRLYPGYPADFIILSDDIFKVAPNRIYDIKVLTTFIGGKAVYNHN
ncbi:MAG: amidohydrolase [bacterium]